MPIKLLKRTWILGLMALYLSPNFHAQNAFETTWTMPNDGSLNHFEIQVDDSLTAIYNYNYSVSWVDYTNFTSGAVSNVTGSYLSPPLTPGATYTVRINGNLETIKLYNSAYAGNLYEINQWGDIQWKTLRQSFKGCTNLEIVASDTPDLSNVQYLYQTFDGCTSLTGQNGNMNWNTSNVMNIDALFRNCTSFNGDINSWDVSNVQFMSGVFKNCTSYNRDLDQWNTASVVQMSELFYNASQFDKTLNTWVTDQVTNMEFVFKDAVKFNQDINAWNTSNVVNMEEMFNNASAFNQPLNSWITSNVINMASMFQDATAFNQYINHDPVTGAWNTARVRNMAYMFDNAIHFNQPLDLWSTGLLNDMTYMFHNAQSFDQPLNTWNTSSATSMMGTFNEALIFNQPLDNWITDNVLNMSGMFYKTQLFNQILNTWNTSEVRDMSGMFGEALKFNGDISSFNTKNVTTMENMFRETPHFNQNISAWNTLRVKTMGYMFYSAESFDQDLSLWRVDSVWNFKQMFRNAVIFNSNLNSWNVSSGYDMSDMFHDAFRFNGDVSSWNVSNVFNMYAMFLQATSFDQDISAWDMSNVHEVSAMLAWTPSFNRDLGNWTLKPGGDHIDMLKSSGLDCFNYDATLNGWANNINSPSNVNLGVINLNYTDNGVTSHEYLENNLGWTFVGDGSSIYTPIIITNSRNATLLNCSKMILNPNDGSQKLVDFFTHSNTFTPATITVCNNDPLLSLPNTVTVNASEFFETYDGQYTARLSAQLVHIDAPDLTAVQNGGVRVRIYYNANVHQRMASEATANGRIITAQGWYLTQRPNTQTVLDDFQAVGPILASSTELIPETTGTENGVDYADFRLTSFGSIGYFTHTGGTFLPVQLLDLAAEVENETTVRLDWATASEFNNSGFVVERSNDLKSYKTLGFVATKGNGNKGNDYAFYDESPMRDSVNYYRLKQIDNDGAYVYTKIVSAKLNGHKNMVAALDMMYPNPTTEWINLELSSDMATNMIIQVIDNLGRVVKSQNQNLEIGFNHILLNVNELSNGIYTLNLKGSIEAKTFVISR